MIRKSIPFPFALALLMALLIAVVCSLRWNQPADGGDGEQPAAGAFPVPHESADAPAMDDSAGTAGFRTWLAAQSGGIPGGPAALAEGTRLAGERRTRMARWIRENPELALAEALTYAEWEKLPPEIRALVETPFSTVAHYDFLPVCGDGNPLPPGTPDYVAELTMPDGTSLEAFVFGARLGQSSKKRLPVQGIALDGAAALRPETMQALHSSDLAAVRRIFDAKVVAGSGPVHALVGGSLVAFADHDALAAANERLTRADARPGPVAASSYLLPEGDGEIDWEELESFADEQASAWTETKKKVFMIRINFSDAPDEPFTQAEVSNVMNGSVSQNIEAMSYGKTWIEAEVSANLYTMPQTAAYYANDGSGLNTELIRDARNTFRSHKSGADAAINIGPVSNTGSGSDGGLGDYQIVGVTFGDIGMRSGGVYYAGLASVGGVNLWMQNSNSFRTFVHEFGHNYGLGHASSWDVASGNSVDPAGTSSEYGDIFDRMGSGPLPEGHFHVQGKARLDWLDASQWNDATTVGSATYRIHRIDAADTTATVSRGVRVTKAASPAEYYWISYRPAFADNPAHTRGVYLIWQRPNENRSWLLDTTPGSPGGKDDSAITLGRTYSDATAQAHFTPLAAGGAGADQWVDVRVNLGAFAGNSPPVADPIAGPASVPARTFSTFTGSASDANNDPLAWHWNSKDGLVHDNAPTLTHSWTVGGTYDLDLTVSDMKGGVAGLSKAVAVTDPLDNWTLQNSGSTSQLRASAWGKGRFVVADLWGNIRSSWDGITWINQGNLPDFDRDTRLAFGNNMFVAVGKINGAAASRICYSHDARTWNVAAIPAGVPQMRDVIFANGKFLAAGDGGNVLTSADGIAWSLTSVPGAPEFRRLAWDGSVWLGLCRHAANNRTETVWTSTDGLTWSQQGDLGFSVDGALGRPGLFLVTGWYGGITVSTDQGLNWSKARTPGTTRWSTREIAVADDGTLLAGGRAMDETGQPEAWLVSTDGTAWARSSAGAGYAYSARSIIFGFGRFLTTADGGVIRSSDGFYPENTAPVASFTLAPDAMPAREARLFAAGATDADGDTLTYAWDFGLPGLVVDGPNTVKTFDFGGNQTVTLRVSDGKGGLATLTKEVSVSDPARNWTQRASGPGKTLHAITANADIAVAVGGNGGVILTSPDGVTWTTRTITSSTNVTLSGAVWDGGQFVTVGQDYNFDSPAGWQGCVYTSPDGISWTRRFGGGTQRNNELHAVAAGDGGLVAVGNNGTILQSGDGITWNPVAVADLASSTLKGVSFGGGTWLVSGHSVTSSGTPRVFTSTNRLNWMDQTAGAGLDSWQDIRKTAWLNDRFVGSGWYSRLRVSIDLGATFTTTRADREETPALAYGDNIYFAAGINYDASSNDVDLLSLDGVTWTRAPAPTTDERNGAEFFKHTFITVGANGSIWQSDDVTPGGAAPNQPPLFAGYATDAAYETPAVLPLAQLMGAASDPDGDVILATDVTPVSAQGGRVALGSDAIHYTPPAGFSGGDAFQLTITDARGASVTGTVNVAVGDPAGTGLNPLALTLLPGGAARIDFSGIPGQTYQIERSTNLGTWTLLETVTADPGGNVSHTDPSSPTPKAFYRIRKP